VDPAGRFTSKEGPAVTQTIFTVVAEIAPDRLDSLRGVVAEIAADPGTNAVLGFGQFTSLHFASVVIFGSSRLPPTLIVENNVDGPLDDWLPILVARGRTGIDTLFAHCVGYPVDASAGEVVAWLGAHVVRPGAYHVGATGRSLARIRQEAALHGAIEDFIDAEHGAGRLAGSPPAVRAAIQDFVRADPRFAWAAVTPPRQTWGERGGHLGRLAAAVTGALLLSPLLIPVLAAWIAVLRVKEAVDPVQRGPADPDWVNAQQEREDLAAQNHLASVIAVKPGFVRATTLPIVLWALNLLARVAYTHGDLGGIPSIHFAHWSLIDEGRHLVFLSNFDGSWESYLGDFIDKASVGLTAVWSNTEEFPRTRFLAFAGAADGPRFRQWARAHGCPTDAWYSAYPELTMPIIDNNTALREGLYARLHGEEVQAWLRRL
jgi:hypothetical protein